MAYEPPSMPLTDSLWDSYTDIIGDDVDLNVCGNISFAALNSAALRYADAVQSQIPVHAYDPYDLLTTGSPLCDVDPSCWVAQSTYGSPLGSVSDSSGSTVASNILEDNLVIIQAPPPGTKEKRKAQNRAA